MAIFWLKWAAIVLTGWFALACVAGALFCAVVSYGKRREQHVRRGAAALRADVAIMPLRVASAMRPERNRAATPHSV